MDDRVIRVSAGVDQGGFQALRSELQSATREVEKLGAAMAGLSRGGPGAISVSGGRAEAAPPGYGAGGARPEGGIGQTLTMGMAGVGPALQRAASDARTHGRSISDAIRDAASAGEAHVRRLMGTIQALGAAMHNVSAGQMQLPGMGAPSGGGPSGPQMGLPGISPGGGNTLHGLGNQVIPIAGTGGPAGPAGGWGTVHAYPGGAGPQQLGLLQRNVSSFLPEGVNNAVSSLIPSGMRGAAAKYGPWAAAAYGAYKTYDWMTASMSRSNVSNAEETINEQYYPSSMRAGAGHTFGSAGVSILNGDLGMARATRLAMKDTNLQRLMGQDMTIRREQLGAEKAGLPFFNEALTGESMGSTGGATIKNVKALIGAKSDQLVTEVSNSWGEVLTKGVGKATAATGKASEMVGKALDWVVDPIGHILGKNQTNWGTQAGTAVGGAIERAGGALGGGNREDETTRSRQAIAMQRSNVEIAQTRMEDFRKVRDAHLASDPLFNMVSGNLMSGAMGTMGMLRGAGMGQSEVKDANGKVIGYSGDRWANSITARGFDPGQAVALRQAVAASGGRGMMGQGDSLLGMQAGGLHNAAQLLGVGAQIGGGRGYLNAVQGAIGRGGLDVTAGGELSSTVLGLLRQGDAGIGGDRAFQTIAGAAYMPGQSSAESVRSAQAMAGGLQFQAKLQGGGIDPLGQALTRRAALRVAGSRGYAVADELEALSRNPAQMMQMAQGGAVPKGLQAFGITGADAAAMQKEGNLQNVVRLIQRGLPKGSVVESAANRLIATGGDVNEAIYGQGGVARRNMGDAAVDEMMGYRKMATLTGRQRTRSDELEKQAKGVYGGGLAGLSRLIARSAGDQGTPEEVEAALEAQMGAQGVGRRARGSGAGDTIGKDALEKVATRARGALGDQESQEKYNQSEKFKTEAKQADMVAVAMGKANEQMQGAAGSATNLKVQFDALEKSLARINVALSEYNDLLRRRK